MPASERVITHNGIVSVRTIIIQVNKLLEFRKGGESINIFSIGNINTSCNQIRGIEGSFVQVENIINWHGR